MSKEFIILRSKINRKLIDETNALELYEGMSKQYKECVDIKVFCNYVTSNNKATFLWHDYEGWGANAQADQSSQFAAIRTDSELNQIDVPIDIYCKPSLHRLPIPIAVQITHISPLFCLENGLPEYDFFTQIREEMMVPLTNTNAYNGIGYDREMTRFALYRNLYPAYEQEYANGNSYWDLLMPSALYRALRPGGIVWPKNAEGKPSLRLEDLAKANGIVQENAHNAVDDVKAYIEWARKLKSAQPKLWDYLYDHKHKKQIKTLIKPMKQILMYCNMGFGVDNLHIAPVLPLFFLQNEPDSLVAINLREDCQWLKGNDPEKLNSLLFMKKADLEAAGKTRPPVVKIKLNKCPVFAPLSSVTEENFKSLNIDPHDIKKKANAIVQDHDLIRIIKGMYKSTAPLNPIENVELQLYSGNFLDKSDSAKLKQLHDNGIEYALKNMQDFKDERILPLIRRVLAKNYPEQLPEKDLIAWKEHCIANISGEGDDNNITLENYMEQCELHIIDPELRKDYIKYVEFVKSELGLI